jgi:signal transduction histidine kinase
MHAKHESQAQLINQLKENERLQESINQSLEAEVLEQTTDIQMHNEELASQQEELAAQRDMLEDQNKVIAESMKELQKAKAGLEETVAKRSTGLKRANRELLQRNDQLEQYAFITAHNLRAPVARLKGLIFLFKRLGGKKPKNWEIFEKISGSAIEMDETLTAKNTLLEVENQSHKLKQFIDLGLHKQGCKFAS